jgi:3-hydroxyisobutyrate dehydrogenase-like beta-hydroxyacid dehydrogenase
MTRTNPSAPPEQIGLIGAGLMGTALSERLLQGGFRVLGWDLDGERLQAVGRLGSCLAASAREVVRSCNRILLSLPTLTVVAEVLRQTQDELRTGQILIDTTTGGPRQAERLGSELALRDVTYLDATISGSSAQVRRAEVTVMVGGPANAFEQCLDLFHLFARQSFHLGPCGSGAKMKLVTNLVLGLNRAALAEGLAFADALGVAPAQALVLLRESMAYSRIMDTKGEKMVAGDFQPEGKLSQHLKDVRLILEAAENVGLQLPLSRAHRGLLEAAESEGFGPLDNSAILRAYDRLHTSTGGADAR